ncbi:MAG: sensor histidine kinase [Leptonema sp. (in: bacteria)]
MNKKTKKRKTNSIKNSELAIQNQVLELQKNTLPVLAAGLAHELKNPLAAIHLHLQLLENQIYSIENSSIKENLLKRIQVIKKEIISLNKLLQEFIKMIRAEKRTYSLKELDDLIPSIISLLEPQAKKANIEIEFQKGELPEKIKIDPIFIKQILINLMINSIQAFYVDRDPTKKRRIKISIGMENEVPFLRVMDNGPGIPERFQKKIFEPFFTTKQEGSGLGLSLVKKMVEEMNGTIDFISKEGEGTVFTIYFSPNPNMIEKKDDSKQS